MVKHVVMWKLRDEAEGASKEANLQRVKEQVEALRDKVPGVVRLEVGINFELSGGAWDIVLYSEFASRADLAAYQVHPEHVRVANFIAKVREVRAVVDYETDG